VPIFGFHGTPGSRLMLEVADAPARRCGVRLIAPDRPGFGLSDFQPERTFCDWPDDVLALAEALGIARFAVAGVSGGGPYALACAFKLATRLTGIGVISGMGPVAGPEATPGLDRMHRLLFGLWSKVPGLTRRLMGLAKRGWDRVPEKMYARIVRFAPKVDRAIMTRDDVRAALIDGLADGFRVDGRGVAHELILFGRAWDFSLADIAVPVALWHGDNDHLVPVAMGRHMAARIPECRAEFVPGAGHYWVFDHIETLLRRLSAPQAGSRAAR